MINLQPHTLDVAVYYLKDEEDIVVNCPALKVVGYGKTPEQAQESFDIELDIFMQETIERGTFEKCLLEYGWTLKQVPEFQYIPPETKAEAGESTHKMVSIPIPIP